MLIFLLLAIVNGFLGIGPPATAMGLLTLVMDPIEAISILIIPLILTELAQYLRAPNPARTAINFRFFAKLSVFHGKFNCRNFRSSKCY